MAEQRLDHGRAESQNPVTEPSVFDGVTALAMCGPGGEELALKILRAFLVERGILVEP